MQRKGQAAEVEPAVEMGRRELAIGVTWMLNSYEERLAERAAEEDAMLADLVGHPTGCGHERRAIEILALNQRWIDAGEEMWEIVYGRPRLAPVVPLHRDARPATSG